MTIFTALFGVLIAGLSAWTTNVVKNAFEERKQRTEWRKELLEKYKDKDVEFQKFSQQFATGLIFIDDKANPSQSHQKYFIPRNFSFTIGRFEDCDLVITENTASRIHCLVTATNDKLYLEDLSPTNPTLINKKKIDSRIEVKDNIEATIGRTTVKIIKLASTTDDMNPVERWIHRLISS